jgi:hypothetical protein
MHDRFRLYRFRNRRCKLKMKMAKVSVRPYEAAAFAEVDGYAAFRGARMLVEASRPAPVA